MSEELETVQRLALAELQAGNVQKTIELMRESIRLTETLHGPDSLETAQALSTLALCLARSENSLTEARTLGYKSLEIRKSKKGNIDVSIALTAEFLASVESRLENFVAAEDLLRLCLSNALAIVGPSHINTAKIQYSLGLVLAKNLGKTSEARELFEASYQTRFRVAGNDAPETVQSKSALLEILNQLGDFESLKKLTSELIPQTAGGSAPFQHSMR